MGGTAQSAASAGTMLNFRAKAKPEERRRSERHAARGLAKMQTGAGSLPRDCWISDISDGGVRLHSERMDVPDDFTLVLPGPNGRRECRVVWRVRPGDRGRVIAQAPHPPAIRPAHPVPSAP